MLYTLNPKDELFVEDGDLENLATKEMFEKYEFF